MEDVAQARVHLCGRLTVELGGERLEGRLRGRQGRLLFAHLAVNRNRPLTRDELVEAVWPFEPPPQPGPALSTLLSHLRAALGPEAIQGRAEIQLVLPPDSWVDVEAASEALGRAQAALARGDWQEAWSPAHVARTIAERGFLPSYDAPWIDVRRRGLENLLLDALECLATLGVRLGGQELAAAERVARRLVELAPLRESGHVALMELQEARGNAAEGLRAYEDLRRVLDDELGTVPGTAAQEVHRRLLGVDAAPTEREPPAPAPATSLPALLETPGRASLVGRARDLERLELALERTGDVPCQLVLVAGDPGIGKTRLLAELGRRAHDRGVRVLYGRTDEDGLAPYGPFLEALRQHVGAAAPELLCRGSELGGEHLRSVLPGLPAPDRQVLPPAAEGDAGLARFRLFDGFSALLVDAARDVPLALLLDDLHAAEEPTILLLKHVLRAPDQRHLLVVATCREAELHRATTLLDALADLQREVPLDRLHLRGLARADIAELARALMGNAATESLVSFVHEETEGNPFFALELMRHLAAAGLDPAATGATAGDRLPEGVREVIVRRLARLGEPAQRALRAAAVVGREFDLDLLEAVAGVEGDALVEAIEEAVAERVVVEAPDSPDRYRFAHALTRTALYTDLSSARRVRLHERVAQALTDLADRGRPVGVSELAAHALAAVPRGDAGRAADLSAQAAAEATEVLAYEDASAHLTRALDVLERHRPDDVARRSALLQELGHSQRRSGRMPQARETFLRAIEVARARGDVEGLAHAALGYGGRWFESVFLDATTIELLEEALTALGEDDSLLRLELLSRLAKALYYSEETGDEERRVELGEQTIDMAIRLGGPDALLVALEGRHYALARPENLDERLTTAERIVSLAGEVGDVERGLLGRFFLISDLVEADRMDDADREIAEYGRLAEASRLPLHRWYHARLRAMRALLEGHVAEARMLAQEAFELGRPVEPRTAIMHLGVQTWFLGHLEGRLSDIEETARDFAPEYPRAPGWRLALIYGLLDQGRRDEAAATFRPFREDGFRNLPRDASWGSSLALAAGLLTVGLGDARDAEALYELIRPFTERNAVTAEAIACLGPLSLYAGLCALVMGKLDAAIEQLDDALERCVRTGARPFEHTVLLALVGALLGRAAPGDGERAEALGRRAEEIGAGLAGAWESARRLGFGAGFSTGSQPAAVPGAGAR